MSDQYVYDTNGRYVHTYIAGSNYAVPFGYYTSAVFPYDMRAGEIPHYDTNTGTASAVQYSTVQPTSTSILDFIKVAGNNIETTKPLVVKAVVAGSGLSKTGSTMDVNADDATLEISSDSLRVKADGINDSHIDWGTGANQVNAEDVPLTTHVWTQVSAPSDVQDLGEKLDAKINDIVGGGTSISMANGVATRGQVGSVDVAVDNVGLEVSGVVGSDFLQLKDLGVTDAKIASATISNSKLVNDNIDVKISTGLTTTAQNIALGGEATLGIDWGEVVRTSTNQTISGVKSLSDTTEASSSSTGCLILSGGLGCSKAGYFDGSVSASSHISTSDERLKSDVKEITPDLDKFRRVKWQKFKWLDSKKRDAHEHAGVLAQSLKKVFPEYVRQDDRGFYSVEYQSLFAEMMSVMQNMEFRIRGLEERLEQQ